MNRVEVVLWCKVELLYALHGSTAVRATRAYYCMGRRVVMLFVLR